MTSSSELACVGAMAAKSVVAVTARMAVLRVRNDEVIVVSLVDGGSKPVADELLQFWGAGVAQDLRPALFMDLAFVHEDDAVSQLHGKSHFVGDQHHGHAGCGQFLDNP